MPIRENRALWTIAMTDLEYSAAKKQQISKQASSARFHRPSIVLCHVIGNYAFSCITELLRCYRGIESRLFVGQIQRLGSLLNLPSGEKLGSRYPSSSSSSIFLYSLQLVIFSHTPFTMQPFISTCVFFFLTMERYETRAILSHFAFQIISVEYSLWCIN